MENLRIWAEPRDYGFALYASCPVCGRDVRLGGWPRGADPEEVKKGFDAGGVAIVCVTQNYAALGEVGVAEHLEEVRRLEEK